MSAHHPGKDAAGQEGVSFATALRDCLATAVILIDARREITGLTQEAAQIFGLNTAHTDKASLDDLPAPISEVVRESMTAGKPITNRQIEIRASSKRTLSLCISAVPAAAGNNDLAVALVIHDLTPVRRLELHLQQLDRLANVGTLAADMAHEIKNALVAGKTFVDLLLEKRQDTELADVVRRELERINAIVKGMLKFAGPAKSGHSTVRLHEVLDHSLRLVQHQLEGRSIALNRSFQAASDLVHGDDRELQQAFVNLFLNALDAMGANGTLTVGTETVPADGGSATPSGQGGQPQLRVTIQDTGPGIPAEDQNHLFEPFFTTKPTGTGLGLTITLRIIQKHHGSITVDSQPGQGTAFRIVLPGLRDPGGKP